MIQYSIQYGEYNLENNSITTRTQSMVFGIWTTDKTLAEKTLNEKHAWRNNNPQFPELFAKIVERTL